MIVYQSYPCALYPKIKDLLKYSDDYDYIGSFDNWDKTVKDLKSKINLDLSHIKNA